MPTPTVEKPAIPETIQLEITPQTYETMKENYLSRHPVRSHIETYFEWLKSITPEEVIDFIELNKSLKDAYNAPTTPFKWKLAIATARGILKSAPKYRQQFKEAVNNLDLALTTLKFENPNSYQIIQHYGEKGITFVKQCQEDALIIFGIKKMEEPKLD